MAKSRWSLGVGLAIFPFVTNVTRAEIRVTEAHGEVEVIGHTGSQPVLLRGGEVLHPLDRIVTGFESGATLEFSDDSTVVVRELTDVKIGEFLPGSHLVRTRLWLKAGELSVDLLHRSRTPSDFAVKTATATCSVRGSGGEVVVTPEGTRMEVRHGVLALGTFQGEVNNHAGQQSRSDAQGQLMDDTAIQLARSGADTGSEGRTDVEKRASKKEQVLAHSGGAAPNGSGSSAGNREVEELKDALNRRRYRRGRGRGRRDEDPLRDRRGRPVADRGHGHGGRGDRGPILDPDGRRPVPPIVAELPRHGGQAPGGGKLPGGEIIRDLPGAVLPGTGPILGGGGGGGSTPGQSPGGPAAPGRDVFPVTSGTVRDSLAATTGAIRDSVPAITGGLRDGLPMASSAIRDSVPAITGGLRDGLPVASAAIRDALPATGGAVRDALPVTAGVLQAGLGVPGAAVSRATSVLGTPGPALGSLLGRP